MKRLLFAVLVLGCTPGSTASGAASPSTGTTIDGSFDCKGGAGKTWKATFSGSKIDQCKVDPKEQTLDLRVGTAEDGLVIHVADYTGSGQYQVSGAQSSKVSIVAKGGVGESTMTTVDSANGDPCKASCTIDVTPAGDDLLSIDVACAALTRVDGGTCITCTPTSPTFVRAHGIACKKS